MQAFGYPEMEAHVKEHQAFSAAVEGFERGCATGQATLAQVLEYLKGWLTTHITGVDIRMWWFLEDYLR
jgi:hemerythrin